MIFIKTHDFDYDLPSYLIAQTPLKDRSSSKLLILDKETSTISHKHFSDIVSYLRKGDVLVLNDTKVMPARLIGKKEDTNAVIELLLLKDLGDDVFECLSKPFKRLHENTVIKFGDSLKAIVIRKEKEGIVKVKLVYEGIFLEILEKLGQMPLPPYIHEKLNDKNRYQTVYAKVLGSAAAPTAGLHFTSELLKEIKAKGIIVCYVTLHVGLGTFRPVENENIKDHQMHSEYFSISKETCDILNKAKEEKRRIIAVGTTTTRTLEAVYSKYQTFKPVEEYTNIFIYPPYKFQAIDCLITNFHLPKSTLLMLVCALAGKENIFRAYKEAIEKEYRFFSFGDAMFIKKD